MEEHTGDKVTRVPPHRNFHPRWKTLAGVLDGRWSGLYADFQVDVTRAWGGAEVHFRYPPEHALLSDRHEKVRKLLWCRSGLPCVQT